MALPADYITGTITLTNASNAFTGTGTGWQAADFREGDIILGIQDNAGVVYVVSNITSNTAGTLTQPWAGPTGTYTYRMRYEWDSSRVSAQTRTLIELLGNGNLIAFSGLTGPGVPVFDGPHSMTVRPETDFVRGVAFDVQVATLAGRDAYDGQVSGFAVLVSDVGDGRAAVYSKLSNTSGDWSAPAYITGPASTVPGPTGVTWRGTYSGVTAYDVNDGVLYDGSSWRAKVATTGNVPPALPTTENAQWILLARAGINGSGTGDVVGPAGAVADRIAVYDGTTGKLIKDGGKTLAEIVPGAGSVTNTILADVPTNTFKGRVAAGTGSPQDLTATQALSILKTAGAYAKDNIIGTVSQTSGVPTGEIFETNTNANGTYTKFADGTMICTGAIVVSPIPGGSAATQAFTFPSVFIALPNTAAFIATALPLRFFASAAPTTTGGTVSVGDTGGGTSTGTVRYIAVGRWY